MILSSISSINTTPPTAKINPNSAASTEFLNTLGELGVKAASACSKVVTSSIFVTSLILSADTSLTALAKSRAFCGSLSVTVIEIIRVSFGASTLIFLASSELFVTYFWLLHHS